MDRTAILDCFNKHKTDKGWLHDYSGMYADVFSLTPSPKKIVEIGVKRGKSLAVWIELFPSSYVIGVDIQANLQIVPAAKSAEIIVCDSLQPNLVKQIGLDCDIIIDDGNHNVNVQWRTFKNLFKCCKSVYVIEDIYGIEAVTKLESLLDKYNITGVKRYASKKDDAVVKMRDGVTDSPPFAFYSLVIQK